MEEKVDALLEHMAKSQMELARILAAKKDVVFQMSQLIGTLPDRHDAYIQMDLLAENAAGITKSITSYLNSLADLVDAVSENLTSVMAEFQSSSEE